MLNCFALKIQHPCPANFSLSDFLVTAFGETFRQYLFEKGLAFSSLLHLLSAAHLTDILEETGQRMC